MPAKKKAPKKKSPSKAAKKTAPKKKTASKAFPKKKKVVQKTAPKKAAAKKSAPPVKSGGASKKSSASASKERKNKNTPAVFKVKSKKSGPSRFTLDDVQALLKTKKSKPADGDKAAKKNAADRKKESGESESSASVEKRQLGAASINDILGGNFSPNSSVSSIDEEEKRVPKKWLRNYRSLVELRDHFTNELELHTSETLKRSSREDSGDLSGYGQHQADAGTDTFNRDLALSMVSNEQDALYEIDQAIKRILNGTYGICEITEKAINKARLNAVPFTRFSVEGQVEWEKMNRRKVERGGVFSDNDDGPTLAAPSDDDED